MAHQLTGHGEIFGLVRLKATLWARYRLTAFVLEAFTTDVVFTVASLATEARILTVPVAVDETNKSEMKGKKEKMCW